ncbi:MAG: hypothetical protein RQ899_09390 [Pseudomonadales bacterium]|nr:hypothetical protein [Pseudomonadales bacterium]
MKQLATFIILLALTAPLYAQWLDLTTPGIPRTAAGEPDLGAPAPRDAQGRPDLSGLWVPVAAQGGLFDTKNIQPWALETMARHESNFYADDPRFHCLPSGPGAYPAGLSVGGTRRIVQHPRVVAVLNPDMSYRQIFMDGRDLEAAPFPTWMGYSVGHWEGDTLVVESNGFNDKTWLTREGLPHTAQLRITERYRRTDFGHIELTISYSDPGTFTQPVEAVVSLEYRADAVMMEVVCNESSMGSNQWNGEISQSDEQEVDVPVEVLENYVGTYQGAWLSSLITAEFILEDGEIYLVRTPRYSDTGGNTDSAKYRLVAQSQTAFDCSCGLGFVFTVDDSGVATEVAEIHVSGAWPFERVR